MILIAHRGNLNGIDTDKENSPSYIKKALKNGYDVEIDVWYCNNKFVLGHDKPDFEVKIDFLQQNGLWCHAKNLDALNQMLLVPEIHSFWHQEDDVTLTTRNYIWTYPGKKLVDRSIAVLPENTNWDLDNTVHIGICSDIIEQYR